MLCGDDCFNIRRSRFVFGGVPHLPPQLKAQHAERKRAGDGRSARDVPHCGAVHAFERGAQLAYPSQSIYFSTLNQYKYHPAVVIAAELGSEVRSAARGKVSQIRNDEETGTTLTMELGNGYEAIYGQLADLTVEEGDTIEAGTLIGYVGEPTKYYTLEGSNLYFQLLKDDDPVNPMDFLE